MDKAQPPKGLVVSGLRITPLDSPARLLQPQGRLGNHEYSDNRTKIELAQLLGRRDNTVSATTDDFGIAGVRKVDGNWEVKFKQGLVFFTGEDTTATPVRVYSEATGTDAWITVANDDMAWVNVEVDNMGAVTSAALDSGAALPDTVRHNPPVNGVGGNSGNYVYKIATFTIVDSRLTYRQHHIGAIEVDYRPLVTNVGGASRVIKKWDDETGELQARTITGGTDVEVVEGEDTITINYTGSSGDFWWGGIQIDYEATDPSNNFSFYMNIENGRIKVVEYGASSGTRSDVPGTEGSPGGVSMTIFDT